MNKAIVTGSAGFVGRHLCKALEREGISVVGVDVSNGFDICNKDDLFDEVKRVKPDTIFHLAAISNTSDAAADPARCYAINVGAPAVILDAALEYDVDRVIIADTYLAPSDHYSISKSLMRELVRKHKYKKSSILACANVFGPGDENIKRIVPSVITRFIAGANPKVCIGVKRGLVYIDDVVNAYIDIGCKNSACGSFYSVGHECDLLFISSEIARLMGVPPVFETIFIEKDRLIETNTISHEVGSRILPATSLEDGLIKTIEWYKNMFTP